jgi:alkylated DNA nucleotide flippase Atl1
MLKKILSAILIASLSAACSPEPYDAMSWGFGGAAAGGVIGAGTGALIGNVIPNGAVMASTAVGGLIGIPAGAAIGVSIAEYRKAQELKAAKDIVVNNQAQIENRNKEIEDLRLKLMNETVAVTADESTEYRLYPGTTLGMH